MAIAIGCDEAGFDLKEALKRMLLDAGHEVEDFGCYDMSPVMYPDVALAAATSIVDGRNGRGVLVCGTGIGMAITANKVRGVRAAQCHDTYSAERARKSNDAQVITLGARVIGTELAKTILATWLASEFEPERSGPKVARINEIDQAARP